MGVATKTEQRAKPLNEISTYYFVGDVSFIGDREFTQFGQRAQFSREQYRQIVLGGAAFIPEVDFKRIGFTTEEIAAYGPVASQHLAPGSVLMKIEEAKQVFRDIRKMLREGVVAVESPETVDDEEGED